MAIVETTQDLENKTSTARRPSPIRGRTLLVVVDLVALSAGLVLAASVTGPSAEVVGPSVVAAFVALVWMNRARLYRARFITRRSDEIRRIVNAVAQTSLSVALAEFAFGLPVGRAWLLAVAACCVITLAVGREILRRHFDARRASGRMARRVLLVGDNSEGDRFAFMFNQQPELGYEVVGRVDPADHGRARELTTRVLALADQLGADGVVVAATSVDVHGSNRLVRDLVERGIHVELSSTLADISFDRLTVRPLGRYPVVYIEPRRRQGWRAVAKRTFDLVAAVSALAVLSPVLAALAIAIKVGSKGPVLFRQERVGQHGEPFQVLKFRTMVVDAEARLAELAKDNEGAGPLFKMKDDPRITAVGGLLRKTSLDELPQLWNVVRNEMSLVGPRPALQSEMREWSEDLYGRLRVKPGITGMWQVSGRSSTTFEEYTRLDLYYVDNWSLVVDLSILARTIPAVVASRGAY